ncbi:hypothetical protein SARC_05171 [Sphaeroforma arctica JP610]|uniref:SET domain-containing protein n=1 Tax=Sphaeroforma arctica JP610 TaxID=667725 RepID=A0A0L0G137_9EUKA|nr:hypothetical protein SARC_05171 [Sphaeroforma arctica JP610]KNC82544.1 hypothetical protein SARC_05171 [Sphaeroforma arctica JP610]|eukprot:XP_014156446.1 hypothetical protein SARC_05171 [Sphaeroforma arctica JP610]
MAERKSQALPLKEGFGVFGSESEGEAEEILIDSTAQHVLMRDGFDVFGSESEDEYEGNSVTTPHGKQGLDIGLEAQATTSVTSNKCLQNTPIYLADMDAWHDITSQPLQTGHCSFKRNIATIGGGRAFYAADDIAAGSLIMSERPILDWSVCKPYQRGGERMDAVAVRELLTGTYTPSVAVDDTNSLNEAIEKKLGQLALLCPVSLEACDVAPEVLAEFRASNGELLAGIQKMVRNTYEDQGVPLPNCVRNLIDDEYQSNEEGLNGTDALTRMLLALQFNGFASGLYLHLSIVNHSCNPNCVKTSGLQLPEDNASAWGYSEIRAARDIRKGEELVISYLQPQEQSTPRRQKQLRHAFHFECVCDWCLPCACPDDLDYHTLIHTQGDVSDSDMLQLEDSIEHLESEYREATSPAAKLDIAEQLLEIESSATYEHLPEYHIVRVRFENLRSEVLQQVLGSPGDTSPPESLMWSLVNKLTIQRLYLAEHDQRLADTLLALSSSANQLLVSHPEVATTAFRSLNIPDTQGMRSYIRAIDKEWGVINKANKANQRCDPIADKKVLAAQHVDRVGFDE